LPGQPPHLAQLQRHHGRGAEQLLATLQEYGGVDDGVCHEAARKIAMKAAPHSQLAQGLQPAGLVATQQRALA
jgi:hypothetical protein